MTYEEITAQAEITIKDFMERAKSSEKRTSAEFYFNAAWGAKMFWQDLSTKMHVNWKVIDQQTVTFDSLVDRESVSLLKMQ